MTARWRAGGGRHAARFLCLAVLLATLAAVGPTVRTDRADAGVLEPVNGYVTYEADGTIRIGRMLLDTPDGSAAPVEAVSDTGLQADIIEIGAIALDPAGFLVATDVLGDRIYTIEPGSGTVVDDLVINADLGVGAITVTTGGRILVAEGNELFEVDTATGDLLPLLTVTDGVTAIVAVCNPGGAQDDVYAFSESQATLFIVDLDQQSVFPAVNPVGLPVGGTTMAADARQTLWGLNRGIAPQTFTIEAPVDGSGTSQNTGGAGDAVGLAIVPPACPTDAGAPDPAEALELLPTFTG